MLAATHLAWTTSRAAGIAALLCSSASVGLGLLMATRLLRGRLTDLRTVHEALSLATLTALLVHVVTLLLDTWLRPGLRDVLVPFTLDYRPLWTGLGTLGGYLLVTLGLTYYVRDRIGPARWRRLHRFAALGWLLAVVHSLGAGSDAGRPWFLAALGLVALPAAALLVVRWLPRPAARDAVPV